MYVAWQVRTVPLFQSYAAITSTLKTNKEKNLQQYFFENVLAKFERIFFLLSS